MFDQPVEWWGRGSDSRVAKSEERFCFAPDLCHQKVHVCNLNKNIKKKHHVIRVTAYNI